MNSIFLNLKIVNHLSIILKSIFLKVNFLFIIFIIINLIRFLNFKVNLFKNFFMLFSFEKFQFVFTINYSSFLIFLNLS